MPGFSLTAERIALMPSPNVCLRANSRREENLPLPLEEMQTRFREVRPQRIHQAHGHSTLALDQIAHRVRDIAIQRNHRRATSHLQRVRALHQLRQMRRPEMLFRFRRIGESLGLLPFLHFRLVNSGAARLLLPLLDHGGVVDVFDLALEIGEAHPAAEALFVKLSDRDLVAVMIRRTKQHAAETMARDGRVVSFRRISLHRFDRVKLIEVRAKCAALDGGAVE
jgi:hypothetical protein